MAWMVEVDVADEAAWMTWDDGLLEGVPEPWQLATGRIIDSGQPLYPTPESEAVTDDASRAALAALEAGGQVWGDAWQTAVFAWVGFPIDPSYYETPEGTIP
jgi:hypothetical protein